MFKGIEADLRVAMAVLTALMPGIVTANQTQTVRKTVTIYKQFPQGHSALPPSTLGRSYVAAMSESGQSSITVDPNIPQNCPDINNDLFVNLKDFASFAINWLETGINLAGDFDKSEAVDTDDLTYLAGNWLTDPGCPQRISERLPYLSSFEHFQGYTAGNQVFLQGTDLDFQMSWQVEQGVAVVSEDVAIRADTQWHAATGLPDQLPYQYLLIGYTPEPNSVATVITKEFDDQGSDHRFVRVHLLPAIDMQIKIMNGATTIAGVHFDPNAHISAWDDGAWRGTGENYAFEYTTGWTFFLNNAAYNSAYQNITLDLNYATHEYDVVWNGNTIYSALADPNSSAMTHVQIETSARDAGILNRISISDFSNSTLDMEVTSPCACSDDLDLKGNVPITGQAWGEDFGLYELYLIPAELDLQDLSNWSRFEVHNQVVDSGGTLGHFDGASIPNGIYYWGMKIYDDLGISESLDVIFKQVFLNDVLVYNGPGQFPVSGDLKVNTFTHTEEPDISIPWPGQFPFELKRTYNNNRRFFPKPLRNGWTHNFQITLFEDSSVHPETFDNGGRPFAKFDNNFVPFGLVYVTFPDGRRKLFRHLDGNEIKGRYTPWPDNGSGDVIERTSFVEDLINPRIIRFLYTYTTRDGITLTFNSGTINLPYSPISPNSNLFSRVVSPVSSMKDRFNNQLNITWNSEKTAVMEVSEAGHPSQRAIKFYDTNNDEFYEEARLIAHGDESDPLRRVLFDWLPTSRNHTVTAFNDGVGAGGN